MKTIHKKLAGLLILQLVLAVGIYWHQQQSAAQFKEQSLFSLKADVLNKITISDGEQAIELVRTEQGDWQLPSLQNVAVDDQKLKEVVDKLNDMRVSWPVAKTSSSHQRFEVSEEQYQRRLQFFQGDQLVGDLLIGTSPGFRKVHVRRADDDEVYSVTLNAFDFPVEGAQWFDKNLLAVEVFDRIKADELELLQVNNQWAFARKDLVSTAPSLDQNKAMGLITSLQTLSVNGIADKALDLTGVEGKQVTVISGDSQWQYHFMAKDDKYYVKRNDIDLVFISNKINYDQFSKISVADLSKAKTKGDEEVVESSPLSEGLNYKLDDS